MKESAVRPANLVQRRIIPLLIFLCFLLLPGAPLSAVLLLLLDPCEILRERRLGDNQLDRIEFTTELFLAGEQLMNGAMAVRADRNGLAHLNAREVLLEPLVGVASARNKMVLGCARFGSAVAQVANAVFTHLENPCCHVRKELELAPETFHGLVYHKSKDFDWLIRVRNRREKAG